MSDIINPNGENEGNQAQVKDEAEDPKRVAFGFDEKGFFIFKIHQSAGQATILGWLFQCMDIVKVHFANTHAQEKSRLSRPKGFLNKWR